MSEVEITKSSSRGQIVIPKPIRDELDIQPGDYFAVYSQGDTILLKKITMVHLKEQFDMTANALQERAQEQGITQQIVSEAVEDVRYSE